MKLHLLARLVLAALPALPLTAAAETGAAWQFSGFATAGVVYTDSDRLEFARIGIDAPGGDKADFGPDSVLGLQAGLRLGDRNAAVLQLVTRETQRGDYDPRAALAFFSHALTDELTLRAGRLRSPFFMLSDTADINYSQIWVRPPVEVYGLNPFADLDGIDLLYRTRIGASFVELHPYAGRSRVPVIGGGRARLDDLMGIRFTVETGRLSLSAGYARANLAVNRTSSEYRALVAPLPPALQAQLSGTGADATFSSLGLQWDDGRWLVSAELAHSTADAFANSSTAAYLAVGRRFGSLTPYLGLARQWQDEPLVDPAAGNTPTELALIDGFNRSRNQAQRSITAGLRWDVRQNTAIKAELAHVRTDAGAYGTFIARGNPFVPGLDRQSINLMSISIDVVF
ncbi:hypothetical protein CKCBHOJB_00839 [Thauera sp. GDN1]|uniref:porin n=1 Tax=Thauera sp. GDN1 TaxID=2944810 RepID=UPI002479D3D9|nr:porin [Thauera sp. GDN1]WEN41291.1 hypothetical protein CKCBHOJB_00839 [Thauera sp. GDN1]